VALVADWRKIESELPADWDDARLKLTIDDDGDCARAAGLLGAASPFRRGKEIRLYAGRRGAGLAPDHVARLLRRLDLERIRGSLELVSSGSHEPPQPARRASFAERWDAELAGLPPDWSDAGVEIELVSSDYVDRAALLLAPANPQRVGKAPVLRFRTGRAFGYGVSAEMTRRCLERIDREEIVGDLRIGSVLADVKPAYTQGPVFTPGGRVA
jgi:hypothetical protein